MVNWQKSRASIAKARTMRREPTCAERKLWQLLRGDQMAGVRFRRQHTIEPYIVDFACIEQRLVVEADGGQHNGSAGDLVRDEYLRQRDWRVLRFWNNDVLGNPDGVAETILRELGKRQRLSPHPNPSPQAGEGEVGVGINEVMPLAQGLATRQQRQGSTQE